MGWKNIEIDGLAVQPATVVLVIDHTRLMDTYEDAQRENSKLHLTIGPLVPQSVMIISNRIPLAMHGHYAPAYMPDRVITNCRYIVSLLYGMFCCHVKL